jgi:hypothetical protein
MFSSRLPHFDDIGRTVIFTPLMRSVEEQTVVEAIFRSG